MQYLKIFGIIIEVLVAVILLLLILLFFYYFNTINDIDKDWAKKLPECPCEKPPMKKVGDGWAVDIGDMQKHHPGAEVCFRSYPPIKTSQGMSGQQCCYDENGQLITTGKAAGTPDRETSCSGEGSNGRMTVAFPGVLFHYFKDVLPSRNITGKTYRKKWKPSLGDCN